jgi:hypothetical protein
MPDSIVGNDHIHVATHVFLDVLCQRSRLDIARMEEAEFSAALTETNHDFFVVIRPVPASTAMLPSAYPSFMVSSTTQAKESLCREYQRAA